MSTVKVVDVIRRVEYVLQDTNIRWPRLELQQWLNEAYLAIALMRPDASSASGTFTCAAGTRQVLTVGFPTALRLLDVTRNLAATSTKKVVRMVNRAVLDDQRPGWHAEAETVNIEHFMFDPRQPKEFFVYPPASNLAQLEVVYSSAPTAHTLTESDLDPDTGSAEVINLDDVYLSPLVDWILYRAYSKDAEYGANEARAAAAYQSFIAVLSAKNQTDAAANPVDMSKVT